VIVVFVVWMVGSCIVHGTLLEADYAKLPQLFGPAVDAGQYFFPLMILAHRVQRAGSSGAWSRCRVSSPQTEARLAPCGRNLTFRRIPLSYEQRSFSAPRGNCSRLTRWRALWQGTVPGGECDYSRDR
jgi:hypothetical protein